MTDPKTETFFVLAKNETGYWGDGVLEGHQIETAFCLYLIRKGENTHLCSLTPASRADALQNAFIFAEGATEAQIEAGRSALEYEMGGETTTYFEPAIDPAKIDARFISEMIEIDIDEVAEGLDPNSDAYRDAIWEAACDAVNESCYEPAILSREVYDAWEADEAAKRRAENRPVVDFSHRDVLPLFGVAWKQAQESIGKIQGWGQDFEGYRRERSWLKEQGWA